MNYLLEQFKNFVWTNIFDIQFLPPSVLSGFVQRLGVIFILEHLGWPNVLLCSIHTAYWSVWSDLKIPFLCPPPLILTSPTTAESVMPALDLTLIYILWFNLNHILVAAGFYSWCLMQCWYRITNNVYEFKDYVSSSQFQFSIMHFIVKMCS